MTAAVEVAPVDVHRPDVRALLEALTAELAEGGYTPEQMFGYSTDQLGRAGVHLVGARVGGALVGVAGLEVGGGGTAELKRFYVQPKHRGREIADALLDALTAYAAERGVHTLRLETGDRQQAAIGFYRRRGFTEVPRFGPYVGSATSVCMARPL